MADSLEYEIYRGFSCPHAGLDVNVLKFLIADHATEVVRRHLSHPAIADQPFAVVLAEAVDAGLSFDAGWSLAFGEFLANVTSLQPDAIVRCAVGLVLHLHSLGAPGQWDVRLDESSNSTFRFDRWLVPECSRLRVSATPTEVDITCELNSGERGALTFLRDGKCLRPSSAVAAPMLKYEGVHWSVIGTEFISSAKVGSTLRSSESYSVFDIEYEKASDELIDVTRIALNLVGAGAPSYSPWVTRLVRDLLPLRETAWRQNSTTAFIAPGVIALSSQSPYFLAETLVHEATHQYMYALMRLGAFDDGSDPTLYFSPFKNARRPLTYIVITYHAFGNVLLYYKMLRARRLLIRSLEEDQRIRTLEANLEVLERTLGSSQTLTPIGDALWRPVAEQLHSSE
jgi:hypothetical protein